MYGSALIAAFVDLRYRQIPPDGSKLLGFSRQAVHDLHFVSTCLRHFGHQSVVRVHIALVSIVTSEQNAIQISRALSPKESFDNDTTIVSDYFSSQVG
jgi:hypothetical protein